MKLNKRKHIFFVILCCLSLESAICANANQSKNQYSQYAYVGGYQGISEFGIKPDGSLQPLRTKPVAGGLYLDHLLIDPGTKTVYGISIDGKMYSYAIDKSGHLSFISVIFLKASSIVIDDQLHYLYATEGDNDILVYNALCPYHIVKIKNIKISAQFQSLVFDYINGSLLLFGENRDAKGKTIGGILSHYILQCGYRSRANELIPFSTVDVPNSVTVSKRYIVTSSLDNMLTVYTTKKNMHLVVVNRQPILDMNSECIPSSITYQNRGSFLYVSMYDGTQSARMSATPHAIIAYHLSNDGILNFVGEVGRPTSNSRSFTDNTNQFLYVVSEEGTVDRYKISSSGHLTDYGFCLKIDAPTEMVFYKPLKSKPVENQ